MSASLRDGFPFFGCFLSECFPNDIIHLVRGSLFGKFRHFRVNRMIDEFFLPIKVKNLFDKYVIRRHADHDKAVILRFIRDIQRIGAVTSVDRVSFSEILVLSSHNHQRLSIDGSMIEAGGNMIAFSRFLCVEECDHNADGKEPACLMVAHAGMLLNGTVHF
jgi:hypothetical protein